MYLNLAEESLGFQMKLKPGLYNLYNFIWNPDMVYVH